MSKIILVTGASSGIGKAIAKVLSTNGHTVYGTSRRAQNFEPLENFCMVQMDVIDENSVRQAIEIIQLKHGRLDVVVNNAGVGFNGAAEDVSNEEIRNNFELNVIGAWNVCRAVLPIMRNQKSGHIISISSFAGLMGLPFRSVYSATKHALEGMMECLSMEVQQWNVHVSIIEPAEFKTNIIDNRGTSKKVGEHYRSDFQRITKQINEGVNGAPEPGMVGEVVLKIISSQHPKLRYKIAPLSTRLSIPLKRLLPARMFERMMMKRFGL
ncbi:MAG: SDR family oxidoreductase [Flavobacteriales bacterium]|nr:SDR family oxidoreductase [Flavobacteriales bacterium]